MSEENAVMKTEKKELAEQNSFASGGNLEILQEALGGGECTGLTFRFDRIKIPSGGSIAFEVPGDEEETEMAKTITAVIAFHHPAFGYYATKFQGGSNPPDCESFDGIHGTGNPGGLCRACPYNKFGSGGNKSKACKNRHMLYLVREGEIFPVVISLPTGSLKSFTDYVKHQLTKGRKLSNIVTQISLEKATNDEGIVYSKAKFKFVRVLNDDEKKFIGEMTGLIRNYADSLTVGDMTDEEASAEEPPFVDTETGEVIKPLK